MRKEKIKFAHRGITLMEVLIAGIIAVLTFTFAFRSVGNIARVARTNAKLLAAEAYAWELAWTYFHCNYEKLPEGQGTFAKVEPVGLECPPLSRGDALLFDESLDPMRYVRIVEFNTLNPIRRHGHEVQMKRIDVNIAWGNSLSQDELIKRRSLNNLIPLNVQSANIPICIYKSKIERVQ